MRQVLLKAADQIEQHPDTYDYGDVRPECGSPRCVLGWIWVFTPAFAFSESYNYNRLEAAAEKLGRSGAGDRQAEFYIEMTRLEQRMGFNGARWKRNAAICARVLRLYADTHYPEAEDTPTDEVQALLDRALREAEVA